MKKDSLYVFCLLIVCICSSQSAAGREHLRTDCKQALFSLKIRGKECKTSKRSSVTVSMTWEQLCCEPLVAWALGHEGKERLH